MSEPLPPGGVCVGGPACPYKLVSARDGGEVPAQYGIASIPVPRQQPRRRRLARGRDQRRRAASRVSHRSPLGPARTARHRRSGRPDLRSRPGHPDDDPGHGQTRSRRRSMTSQPAGGALGAAISADGSTVAWTGSNAADQTHFLGGENTDPSFYYYLWRRAPFGPAQPTRRITGLADPDDPACAQLEAANPGMSTNFDQISTGPCYGPLTDQEANRTGISAQLPALSGDGLTVAFVTRRRAPAERRHRHRARSLHDGHDPRTKSKAGDRRAHPRPRRTSIPRPAPR